MQTRTFLRLRGAPHFQKQIDGAGLDTRTRGWIWCLLAVFFDAPHRQVHNNDPTHEPKGDM